METIRVKYKGQIYEILSEDEAWSKIDEHDWVTAYMCRQYVNVYIDLETGEVFNAVYAGYLLEQFDFPIIYLIGLNPNSLSKYDNEMDEYMYCHEGFPEFKEEYDNWQYDNTGNYKYNFTRSEYKDVYEAYVVEVLEYESWEDFYREDLSDWLDIMGTDQYYYGQDNLDNFYNALQKSDDNDCDYEYHD